MREDSIRTSAKAPGWTQAAGQPLTAYGLRLAAYGLRLLGPRLLLRQTMDGPESPDQIHRMDPPDRPVADELREDPERHAVPEIVERGHEDGAVRDVEIRVTRGKALSVEAQRRGHRQIDHLELRAVLEPHPVEPLAVLPQRPVVRVVGVLLAAQHHRSRVDEAAQVVHVAVGIVPRDTAPEPQDVGRTEVVPQHAFE